MALTLFAMYALLFSGAALAIAVGLLIEVPVIFALVKICLATCHRFAECRLNLPHCKVKLGEAPRYDD